MTLRLETRVAAADGEQHAASAHIAHGAARVRAIEALGFGGLHASAPDHASCPPLMRDATATP